jgi:hypothetical protein
MRNSSAMGRIQPPFRLDDQNALITGGPTEFQAGATTVELSMKPSFPQCKVLSHRQQRDNK